MIRAIIQYESEPDPERYQQHIDEFAAPVECSAFRHGKVFGSPFGEPDVPLLRRVRVGRHGVVQGRGELARVRRSRARTRWRWAIPFTVHFASVE